MGVIKAGDWVNHNDLLLNGGLRIYVDEVSEDGLDAKCIVGDKEIWYPVSNLKVNKEVEGGFTT